MNVVDLQAPLHPINEQHQLSSQHALNLPGSVKRDMCSVDSGNIYQAAALRNVHGGWFHSGLRED